MPLENTITQIQLPGQAEASTIGVMADDVIIQDPDSNSGTVNYITLPIYLSQKLIKIITGNGNGITFPLSGWQEKDPSTYTNFPWENKRQFYTNTIKSNQFAKIIFNPDDAASGNFAAVCKTDDGYITIYAREKPANDIIVPTIVLLGV